MEHLNYGEFSLTREGIHSTNFSDLLSQPVQPQRCIYMCSWLYRVTDEFQLLQCSQTADHAEFLNLSKQSLCPPLMTSMLIATCQELQQELYIVLHKYLVFSSQKVTKGRFH